MKRMKIPGWGQCASVRGGHGDVPAHSSPSRARWLGMRMLVLTVLLSMMGAQGAWAQSPNLVGNGGTGQWDSGTGLDGSKSSEVRYNGSRSLCVYADGSHRIAQDGGFKFVDALPTSNNDPSNNGYGYLVIRTKGDGFVEVKTKGKGKVVTGHDSNAEQLWSGTPGYKNNWDDNSIVIPKNRLKVGDEFVIHVANPGSNATDGSMGASLRLIKKKEDGTTAFINGLGQVNFNWSGDKDSENNGADKTNFTITQDVLDQIESSSSLVVMFLKCEVTNVSVRRAIYSDVSGDSKVIIGNDGEHPEWFGFTIDNTDNQNAAQNEYTRGMYARRVWNNDNNDERNVFIGATEGVTIEYVRWVPKPTLSLESSLNVNAAPKSPGDIVFKASTPVDFSGKRVRIVKASDNSTVASLSGNDVVATDFTDGHNVYRTRITIKCPTLDYNTEYRIVLDDEMISTNSDHGRYHTNESNLKIVVRTSGATILTFKTAPDPTELNPVSTYKKWTAANGDFGDARELTTDDDKDVIIDGGYLAVAAGKNGANNRVVKVVEELDGSKPLEFTKPNLNQHVHFKVSGPGTVRVKILSGTKSIRTYISSPTKYFSISGENSYPWPNNQAQVKATDFMKQGSSSTTEPENYTLKVTQAGDIYIFFDSQDLKIQELEWMPDLPDLTPFTRASVADDMNLTSVSSLSGNYTKTWVNTDFEGAWHQLPANSDYNNDKYTAEGTDYTEYTYTAKSGKNYGIRIVGNESNSIQTRTWNGSAWVNEDKAFNIVGFPQSTTTGGYLMFPATVEGEVKVTVTSQTSSSDENKFTGSASTGYWSQDAGNYVYISASDMSGYQAGDILKITAGPVANVAIPGTEYTITSPTLYIKKGTSNSGSQQFDFWDAVLEQGLNSDGTWNSYCAENVPLGTAATVYTFKLNEEMVSQIASAGGLIITGAGVQITKVDVEKFEGLSKLSVVASTSPALNMADLGPCTTTVTYRVYGDKAGRNVYIGGTHGLHIDKIEWTPKSLDLSLADLQPVDKTTTWIKRNNFGGHAFVLGTAEDIKKPVLNNGSNDVPMNTLLIYGTTNAVRQTNFTYSGALEFKRPSLASSSDDEGRPTNVAAIKVMGAGVIKVEAAGTGPSGRWLRVCTDLSDMTGTSVMAYYDHKDQTDEAVKEHFLDFRMSQHSTSRVIYAKFDPTKERCTQNADGSYTLYIVSSGSHINEIKWLPGVELPEMCPENSLWISGIGYGDGNTTIQAWNNQSEADRTVTPLQRLKSGSFNTGSGVLKYEQRPSYLAVRNPKEETADRTIVINPRLNTNLRKLSLSAHVYAPTVTNDDRKTAVWTSSMDGNADLQYTLKTSGGLWERHNTKGNTITTELQLNSTDGQSNKGGFVYVVAGTYEGNRTDWRRLEIAGEPDGVKLYDSNGNELEKDKNGRYIMTVAKGQTAPVSARPYLNRYDFELLSNQSVMVDDPETSWTQTNSSIASVRSVSANSEFGASDGNNVTLTEQFWLSQQENMKVRGDNKGITVFTVTTYNGKTTTLALTVLDTKEISLDRQKPEDIWNVAVNGTFEYDATVGSEVTKEDLEGLIIRVIIDGLPPQILKPTVGRVDENGNFTPITGELERDQNTKEITNANSDGTVRIVYDLPLELKKAYGIDKMSYFTEHRIEFLENNYTVKEGDHVCFGDGNVTTIQTNIEHLDRYDTSRTTKESVDEFESISPNVTNKALMNSSTYWGYNEMNNISGYNIIVRTVPDPANIMTETFVYNVLQRSRTYIEDDVNNNKLLNENADGLTWICNHRSKINIYGFDAIDQWGNKTADNQNVNNPDYLKTKIINADSPKGIKDKTGVIRIEPYNPSYSEQIRSIHSIEINFNREATGNKSKTVKVRWAKGSSDYIHEAEVSGANDYNTAIWTPLTKENLKDENFKDWVHYVQLEFAEEGVCIDQIKINYFAADYTEAINVADFKLWNDNNVVSKIADGITFSGFAKGNTSYSNEVKMTFRQNKDIRHFAVRSEFPRLSGYNEGEQDFSAVQTETEKKKNVLVIRDDKTNPCKMFFEETGRNAVISSIEFVVEDDNQRNDVRLFCTSDPRHNELETNSASDYNMVGYQLDDEELTDADYESCGLSKNATTDDPYTFHKLVYRPESPVNFAAIALDCDQTGYLYVRRIIVRTNENALNNFYKLESANYNTDKAEIDDIFSISRYTKGIKFEQKAQAEDASNGEFTNFKVNENQSIIYTLKRTSLQNNLSREILLNPTTTTTTTTTTILNNAAANGSGESWYLHNKNYTLRLMNKYRMVIRQLAYHIEANEVPEIACKPNGANAWKPNDNLRADDPFEDKQYKVRIKLQGTDHGVRTKALVYTLDGSAPNVTFAADGSIADINGTVVLGKNMTTEWNGTTNVNDAVLEFSHNDIKSAVDYITDDTHTASFVVKALALSFGSEPQGTSIAALNAANCYGEPSEIARGNYTFIDPAETYYTTARRTVVNENGEDKEVFVTTLDRNNYENAYDDKSAHGKFFAGYAPLKNGANNSALSKTDIDMLTYGGYELWHENSSAIVPWANFDEDKEARGEFKHTIVTNDYWTVDANDVTPWRGLRTAVAGDTYVVSNLVPMNEYSAWDGSNGIGLGEEGYHDGKLTEPALESAASNDKAAVWKGEFSYDKFNTIPLSDNAAVDRSYKKLWNLPCYGGYFEYEPEADGVLTVYVKQQGVLDQNNGALDDMLAWYRPVFILDEQGNTPAGIVASTSSKVSGDAMTTFHSVAGDKPVVANRYTNAEQSEALFNMCKAWTEENTSEGGKVEFGDRAYHEQGVMALYGTLPNAQIATGNREDGTAFSYTRAENARPAFLGERTINGDNANGFMTVSAGYVRYDVRVKAGKTYFIFAQNGNLGMCSYTFQKTVGATNDVLEMPISDTEANVENWITTNADGNPKNIHIARSFTKNVWNTIVLPFSVGHQQLRRIFGDGVKLIHFDNITKKRIMFFRHAHQTIVAGVPVLIKPTRTITLSEGVTFENVTLDASAATPKRVYCNDDLNSSEYYDYSCVGTYGMGEITQYAYYVNSAGKVAERKAEASIAVKGTRCWIIPNNPGNGGNIPHVTLFGIGGNVGETSDNNSGEATGIDSGIADDAAAMAGDNNVYDSVGRLVRQNTTSLQGLPAGVYIVNGVKHVIK